MEHPGRVVYTGNPVRREFDLYTKEIARKTLQIDMDKKIILSFGGSLGAKNLGYDVVLWLAGLASVPETIYEAARMDGAGAMACFFSITLPCIRPISFTIIVISLLNSFKVFREAWMVAGNYPQESIYLLQHLFNNWFRDLAVDKMSAGAVVLSAVILLLIGTLQKSWKV